MLPFLKGEYSTAHEEKTSDYAEQDYRDKLPFRVGRTTIDQNSYLLKGEIIDEIDVYNLSIQELRGKKTQISMKSCPIQLRLLTLNDHESSPRLRVQVRRIDSQVKVEFMSRIIQ